MNPELISTLKSSKIVNDCLNPTQIGKIITSADLHGIDISLPKLDMQPETLNPEELDNNFYALLILSGQLYYVNTVASEELKKRSTQMIGEYYRLTTKGNK